MAKFFQASLIQVTDVIKFVYPEPKHKHLTLEDRLPNEARCPDCGKDEWWLLPKRSAAVRQGGKPYIECLNCGYQTHL